MKDDIKNNLNKILKNLYFDISEQTKELNRNLSNLFFGSVKDGVIGLISTIDLDLRSYNGLSFSIAIHYIPLYVWENKTINIYEDLEEAIHISPGGLDDFDFHEDLTALKLLLEVGGSKQ